MKNVTIEKWKKESELAEKDALIILKENRNSIISAIKWYYRCDNFEMSKEMSRVLKHCKNVKRINFLKSQKNIKTALKHIVYSVWIEFKKEKQLIAYQSSPSIEYSDINDLMTAITKNTKNRWGI